MSTAALVPETRELTGDDAWTTITRTGRRRLLKDAFMRMRVADGFSHARSLAFMTALVAIQGVIALVGLATVINKRSVSDIIVATIHRAVPGDAGGVLTAAVQHSNANAAQHNYSAFIFGTLGCLLTATTALGQLERGLNRLYGVEMDRPTVRKYGLAFLFALSVGLLVALAFACMAFGREIIGPRGEAFRYWWAVLRWPLGLLLNGTAVTLLFRWSPRRRQPRFSWLAFGAGVAVLLWTAATIGLGFFYRHSASFGQTYGPLAGLVALLVWCLLSSIALFLGAAIAAQLEAVRAGSPKPQDAGKVADSEPDAAPMHVAASS